MQVVKNKAGVVLLTWQADYPQIAAAPRGKGDERIARFYARLAQETEAFCERLSAAAAADYEADTNPRKRFCFAPYRLTVTAQVVEADDAFLIVERQAHLARRGEATVRRQTRDIFHRPTGYLCSRLAYRLLQP